MVRIAAGRKNPKMWKLKVRNTVVQLARAHRTLQSKTQRPDRRFPIFSTSSCSSGRSRVSTGVIITRRRAASVATDVPTQPHIASSSPPKQSLHERLLSSDSPAAWPGACLRRKTLVSGAPLIYFYRFYYYFYVYIVIIISYWLGSRYMRCNTGNCIYRKLVSTISISS